MTIFITSDQHYFHSKVREYCSRNFATVEEMNEALIANHNAVVQDNDIVWHLGDFSLSEKVVPLILPRLKGTHYLVAGNHDKCYPARNKKSDEAKKRYIEYGFKEVHIEYE